MNTYRLLIILLAAILLGSCARSFNPDVERGADYHFRLGYPEVQLTALNSWNENQESYLQITANVVYGSLYFKRFGDKRKANLAIELQILETERDSVITSTRFSYDQVVDSPKKALSQDVFTFNEIYPVPPGKYEVIFSLVDQNTGRKTTRRDRAHILNPQDHNSFFSNIQLFGKKVTRGEPGQWIPIPTYDVPGRIDSLKFEFQVNNQEKDNLTINISLLKFDSDTTAAREMHRNPYSPSDISYKGIDYGDREFIQTNRRVLTQQGNVSVELTFPMLQRGNYRFSVQNSRTKNVELFKARDFGIKSPHYPTLKSPQELAQPLVYLMNESEYEELMQIKNPDSLKMAVDRFWLRHIGNKSDAKSVISLYYERVEQANKLFSNFKEGWKTDRGMMYVLFGAPISTQQIHDSLTWSYSYNRNNPDYNFTFDQNRFESEFFPFEHYLLQRDIYYYQLQYKQRELWLSGLVLIRKL